MIQLTPVIKNLIIITAIVFLACMAMPMLEPYLTGYYFFSPLFRPWQIVTHMFMHGSLAHIFFNMYALVIFGPALEARFGGQRFLFYYISCGVGAYLLHEGINYWEIQNAISHVSASQYEEVMRNGLGLLESGRNYANEYLATINAGYHIGVVGASGAVFGVLLAFGVLYSDVELRLLFPPIALKAKWFVFGYGAIELLMALNNAPNDNVAHYAHIGGMLFGYIIIKVWQKQGTLY